MNIFSSSHPSPNHTVGRRAEGQLSVHRPSGRASDARTYADEADVSSEGGFASALFAALFALPVTAVIGFVLLLIATAVAYANADPDAMTMPCSLVALGLTALMGGMVAAMRGYRQPLLSALLLGFLLIVLQLGGTLFYGDGMRAELSMGGSVFLRWGLRFALMPLALLGGRLGKRKHRQERRSKQHTFHGK